MIREINLSDKKEYIGMADSFYNSNAVSHSIPKENFESAFEAAISNNPFIKLYMLESDGTAAGYAAIAVTFTTEGGGKTLWLDELYGYRLRFLRPGGNTLAKRIRIFSEVLHVPFQGVHVPCVALRTLPK